MILSFCLFFNILLIQILSAELTEEEFTFYDKYQVFHYPTCINLECRMSMFEYGLEASIGRLFDEYLQLKGFLHNGKRKEASTTNLKIIMTQDTESMFCFGLFVQRHLLSLMNTQSVNKTGVAIDLLSVLEKTELHQLLHEQPFYPQSYHMNIEKQRRKFFKQLPCNKQLDKPWIFKTNEHKGKGIFFFDDTSQIRKIFITDEDCDYFARGALFHDCDATKVAQRYSVIELQQLGFKKESIDHFGHVVKGDYIAQKYIDNTLLIDGHKCGIRVFVTVLSLNPYIVLFSDGYTLINAEIFNENDINKVNVLSNREMSQKKKKKSKKKKKKSKKQAAQVTEEWSLSFDQLNEYLSTQNHLHFDINHVRAQLINAANLTFQKIIKQNGKFSKKTQKKLDKFIPLGIAKGILNKDDNNYMWLAIDFLLKTDGNVKLLEINLHPATNWMDHCSWLNQQDTTWQCQQARNITKEIVDVSFDIADRKLHGLPLNEGVIKDQLEFHKLLLYQAF